jgi:hypothetical protein
VEPVLDALLFRDPEEQHARAGPVGIDDGADRSGRRDRDVVGAQEILPREVAGGRRLLDVAERDRPEAAHHVSVDTVDGDLERRRHPPQP